MYVQEVMQCEVCGEPAENFVRDYWEKPTMGLYREFEPVGIVHCFCKAHSRDAIEHGLDPSDGGIHPSRLSEIVATGSTNLH